MSNLPVKSGFTVFEFKESFPVTIFPNDLSFYPATGIAVGTETCNVFGTKRLIVKYDSCPIRKATGRAAHWPNNLLYLSEKDVQGWRFWPDNVN